MNLNERNKLVEDNIKLVYHMVNKYYKSNNLSGYDKEDFISEGFIGLIKAAKSYNSTKKYAFSTYASRCIYNEMMKNTYQYENCQHRKGHNGALSFDVELLDANGIKVNELLGYDEDFSSIYAKEILAVIDKIRPGRSKFIAIKLFEGYNKTEIGKMLGLTGSMISANVIEIRRHLIELGIVFRGGR